MLESAASAAWFSLRGTWSLLEAIRLCCLWILHEISLQSRGLSEQCTAQKTCTNLTGIQTHLPFCNKVHFYSICQLLEGHNLKPKDWYSALSWHSCHQHHLLYLAPLFELPDSKPNPWGEPRAKQMGSAKCTQCWLPVRGTSSILQCSYRKPQWEPDCRFNVKLNHTKRHRNFFLLTGDLQKTKTNHRSRTLDDISALC